MTSSRPSFDVKFLFKGQTTTVPDIKSTVTVEEIETIVRETFNLSDDVALKLIHKGKVIGQNTSTDGDNNEERAAFPNGTNTSKTPKIMIIPTDNQKVKELNAGRSDPTIRGFSDEKKPTNQKNQPWGPNTAQHKHYKFCKIEACTWQSFGHRPSSQTPHAFAAFQLLEKLSTDPGIVAIMTERQLVVNTLAEMDPIDDRIAQKKEAHGTCLLGYNTNRGLRIDLKLRTNDLSGFLPYDSIAATLIHELSHNWVAEHNELFWGNYGQMRVEYLYKHASLAAEGVYVNGTTSAALAGVGKLCIGGMKSIREGVLEELRGETRSYGVDFESVAPAVMARCQEIEVEETKRGVRVERGRRLGGGDEGGGDGRVLALAAAERRRRQAKENDLDEEEKKRHR